MQPDNIKKLFISKYSLIGEERFFKFLITYALNRIVEHNGKSALNPALELIDYYDMFLKLYRREGEDIYLDLSHQFRKAAHKVYHIMRKQGLMERNKKFLDLVE